MARYRADHLKSRAERKFRAEVLGRMRPEKSPSLIWTALNSRLFALVVTGLFVGVLGSFYAKWQECIAEAGRLGERLDAVHGEMVNRRYAITLAVFGARTSDSILAALRERPLDKNVDPSFAGRKFEQLRNELKKILGRVSYDKVLYSQDKHINEPSDRTADEVRLSRIFTGFVPRSITDEQRTSLHALAFEYHLANAVDEFVFTNKTPICSICNVWTLIIGRRPQHLLQIRDFEDREAPNPPLLFPQ